jgi:hypothetical protein
LGDSFSALRAKLVVAQIQTGQRLVYLHGKIAGTSTKEIAANKKITFGVKRAGNCEISPSLAPTLRVFAAYEGVRGRIRRTSRVRIIYQ